MSEENIHFNQKPRRKAEFIVPPNTLKAKVGSGGLSDDVLDKADSILVNNNIDFRPLGELYLESLGQAIHGARTSNQPKELLITAILYPALQLKANGGMFKYELITQISDRLVQFLEVIETPDEEAINVIDGFYTTIRAILVSQMKGSGGQKGTELYNALIDACFRYFEKNPQNKVD